jgi:hypothetical protein
MRGTKTTIITSARHTLFIALGIVVLVPQLATGARGQNQLRVDPTADYGSVAYSPADGRWGYSYNYGTERAAVQAAMGNCRDAGGRGCRTVVWVANGCGAVAIAGRNREFTVATGKYRQNAESNALQRCRDRYGKSCTVKVWVCTSP